MKIAILGTGAVGSKLGRLFSEKGHSVFYGSRTPSKVTDHLGSKVRIGTYSEAASFGEVIFAATPWLGESGRTTLDVLESLSPLDGKIIVDATNPLHADWSPVTLGAENSAGEEIARALPKAHVVKAFNTVFADVMTAENLRFGTQAPTLFLCGDNAVAKQAVMKLAEEIGFDPVDTGFLKNARYLEAMAHLNIQIAVTMRGGTDSAFRYMRRDVA